MVPTGLQEKFRNFSTTRIKVRVIIRVSIRFSIKIVLLFSHFRILHLFSPPAITAVRIANNAL